MSGKVTSKHISDISQIWPVQLASALTPQPRGSAFDIRHAIGNCTGCRMEDLAAPVKTCSNYPDFLQHVCSGLRMKPICQCPPAASEPRVSTQGIVEVHMNSEYKQKLHLLRKESPSVVPIHRPVHNPQERLPPTLQSAKQDVLGKLPVLQSMWCTVTLTTKRAVS